MPNIPNPKPDNKPKLPIAHYVLYHIQFAFILHSRLKKKIKKDLTPGKISSASLQ
jgi:hypothetical protein